MTAICGYDAHGNEFVQKQNTGLRLTVSASKDDGRVLLLSDSDDREVSVALTGWRTRNWSNIDRDFRDEICFHDFRGHGSPERTIYMIVKRVNGQLIFVDSDELADCDGYIEVPREFEQPLLEIMERAGLHVLEYCQRFSAISERDESLPSLLLKPR